MHPQGCGMECIRIPVSDNENDSIGEHFTTVLNFVEEAKRQNGKVLIHCQEGKSRSCSFAIAYMMKTMNLKLKDALVRT